jgi:hypothetical protein
MNVYFHELKLPKKKGDKYNFMLKRSDVLLITSKLSYFT